ncbi:MAG: pyrroline-5-carboxylate reductase [Burkholderiaceae bacterium]|nr:pyrroline-5-carboxylate reductase [Burkholderiaceae bacterium]
MRITFVGGGNMAGALIGGLIASGEQASTIAVVEPRPEAAAAIAANFGVAAFGAAAPEAFTGEVVVIAVKPQVMREVAREIAPHVSHQLVISVAAGIRTADLARWLGEHPRVVRTMPNTPALIGAGVTALAAQPSLAQADRDTVESILRAVGQTLWVDDDSALDAVTAVSGSGPAYVFYVMEAIHAAARAMGLTEAQARTLTLATFEGAAQLALRSTDSPATLRERVTSPNGTTAAAIAVLELRDVGSAIAAAVEAARRRSVELGEQFGRD